jgi:hypothetical protein
MNVYNPSLGAEAASERALFDAIHHDIWTWLHTFVTVNNSAYRGKFAPCPYARAAVGADRVDVKVYEKGDVRAFIRAMSFDLRDNDKLSTRVIALPPRVQAQWGISEFVEKLNTELIADNVFLNTGVTKTMTSRYPGSPKDALYFIVVANRLDAVLSGSEALHRTDYYATWPREQYELVVERRERMAKIYGSKA